MAVSVGAPKRGRVAMVASGGGVEASTTEGTVHQAGARLLRSKLQQHCRLRDSEDGLGTSDVGLHVKTILVLRGFLLLGSLNGGAEGSTKVVAVGEGKATGGAKVLREVVASQVTGRLGLEAKATSAVLRLAEELVDGLIIVELRVITKLTEANRHRLGSRGVGVAGASVAPGETVGRTRRSALEVVLAIHREMLLAEVDLEVRVGVVVPVLLCVDCVSHTDEQGLGLEVGGVGKLDGEGEAVMAKGCFPRADLVAVVGGDLRGGLPVIQGEATCNSLVKGNVGNSH
ncbi:hypothetical protein HG531_011199 [Fusarium graminearum]|nr:hypothetical protein HG531_011199 [Fusarium graminearum]